MVPLKHGRLPGKGGYPVNRADHNRLKSIWILLFLAALLASGVSCVEKESGGRVIHLKPTKDQNSPTGLYIPKDLHDCFIELKKMLPVDFVEELRKGKEGDLIQYHLTLGMWIRNHWGLWKGSRLADYFKSRDVRHPDDMSAIILTSFWRHLNGQPIGFEEQSEVYREYWNIVQKKMTGGLAGNGADGKDGQDNSPPRGSPGH
jgi:hypothetical protein